MQLVLRLLTRPFLILLTFPWNSAWYSSLPKTPVVWTSSITDRRMGQNLIMGWNPSVFFQQQQKREKKERAALCLCCAWDGALCLPYIALFELQWVMLPYFWTKAKCLSERQLGSSCWHGEHRAHCPGWVNFLDSLPWLFLQFVLLWVPHTLINW